MCVLSIKVPIRKKSGNLFNDLLNAPHRSTDEAVACKNSTFTRVIILPFGR